MTHKDGLISGTGSRPGAGSDDIFRVIFEKIQTGILIVDPAEHRIIDANPIAEAIIGRDRDELIGSPCHEFVCPAKCGECPITDFHKDIHNMERAIINAKGERIPILKTVAKATINNHEYLIESFIDIIDRKKAEERKVALIALMDESVVRARKPLELMAEDFHSLAGQAAAGTLDPEELRMQLQLYSNNLHQIVQNLSDLSEQAVRERGEEIPPEFRDFIIRK